MLITFLAYLFRGLQRLCRIARTQLQRIGPMVQRTWDLVYHITAVVWEKLQFKEAGVERPPKAKALDTQGHTPEMSLPGSPEEPHPGEYLRRTRPSLYISRGTQKDT